ncbi:MAG: YgiT-type zinc finger protein [Anaerolineales bacterium]|nr:MAG: YgiT-type zinc finger protein [Anaerolineales bacterium]
MEKEKMNGTCPECHGPMHLEKITVTYERDGVVLLVKEVPAWVCAQCGKRLITGKVATQVSDLLDRLEEQGALDQFRKDVDRLRRTVSQVRAANLELEYA